MAADLVSTGIVHEFLTEENYENWSVCIKSYLQAHDLWDTVHKEFKPKKNGVEFEIWKKKNALALHTIQISCGPRILSEIRQIPRAKVAWDFLAKKARGQDSESSSGSDYEEYVKYADLLRAVERDDFDSVKIFLSHSPNAIGAGINCRGKTAIHVAVTAGHVEMVKKLVQLKTERELEKQDDGGFTALSAAAYIGIKEMAECIYNKNNKLIGIPTKKAGMIPVVVASSKGHVDMVEYLYGVTPMYELIGDNKARGATLISKCIAGKMFDVALDMLRCHPDLAFAQDLEGSSPVLRLSQMPSAFHSKRRLLFWQRPIYSCFQVTHREILGQAGLEIQEPNQGQTGGVNVFKEVLGQLHWLLSSLLKLLGFRFIYKRKLMNVQAVELVHCIAKKIPFLSAPELGSGLLCEAIFQAVRHGIVEFITEIIRANPNLLSCTDENNRDIFMCAVLYRREKIFNLQYGIKEMKDLLTSKVDRFDNNMLHLAGMLEPSSQLDHISGAALKMQRELQWYKEVKSIVNHTCKESFNEENKTPHDVFKENHENMMKEGQKWMKDNAQSCSVVAALMVTIMFAVAFTVPGGDSDETGLPIFLKKTLFKVFIVCDAISFFSSAASATIFLGILTSRYAEKDFLKSLPIKMIAGQITLFISFVTMMVTFSTALILMLRGQSLWLPILIIVIAIIPIVLFVFSQFPLLFEIIFSTYGPSIFNRNTKRWLGDM